MSQTMPSWKAKGQATPLYISHLQFPRPLEPSVWDKWLIDQYRTAWQKAAIRKQRRIASRYYSGFQL